MLALLLTALLAQLQPIPNGGGTGINLSYPIGGLAPNGRLTPVRTDYNGNLTVVSSGSSSGSIWDAGVIILNPSGAAGWGGWDGGVYILNSAPIYVTLGDGGVSLAFPAVQAVTIVDGGTITVTVTNPTAATFAVTVVDGGMNVNNLPAQPYAVTIVDGGTVTVSGSVTVASLPLYVTLGDAGGSSVSISQPLAVTVVDGGNLGVSIVAGNLPLPVTVVDGGNLAVTIFSGSYPIPTTVVDGGLNVNNFPAFPWPVTVVDGGGGSVALTDGTNGPVAVKAASTAPVAADKGLVVSLSPNSQTNTNPFNVQGPSLATAPAGAFPAGSKVNVDGNTPTAGGSANMIAVLGDQYGELYVVDWRPKHQVSSSANISAAAGVVKMFIHNGTDSTWVTDYTFYAVDAGTEFKITESTTGCDGGSGTGPDTLLVGPFGVPAGTTFTSSPWQPIKSGTVNTDICCHATNSGYCTLGGFIGK